MKMATGCDAVGGRHQDWIEKRGVEQVTYVSVLESQATHWREAM
jgi:hypothetical protein